jgi:hypothetical protein
MKRLLYWLYLLVKRQLKNPVIVVVLIAMPVAALIITNTASLKEKEPVRVGIVLEDDDKIAIMTRDYLVNGDYSVQFYEAESQEKLEQDIMNKRTECGYVVGTGLKDKLDSGSYRDIIELIICRSDFVSSMTENIQFINETAAYTSTTIPSMEAMNSPTVETARTPDIAGTPSLITLIIMKNTSNIIIYTMPTPAVLAIPVSNADIPAPLRLFASVLL